jgi:hypothetical protein
MYPDECENALAEPDAGGLDEAEDCVVEVPNCVPHPEQKFGSGKGSIIVHLGQRVCTLSPEKD